MVIGHGEMKPLMGQMRDQEITQGREICSLYVSRRHLSVDLSGCAGTVVWVSPTGVEEQFPQNGIGRFVTRKRSPRPSRSYVARPT